MSQSTKICAHFTDAFYEEEGNFTKYNFNIRTTFTHWRIEKRYSDFERLHNELSKLKYDIDLPTLPSKIFWKQNSRINVSKRAIDLETYLNHLLSNNLFLTKELFLHFIEITDEVLLLFKRTQSYFESEFNSATNESLLRAKSLSTCNDSYGQYIIQANVYSDLYHYHKKQSANDEGRILVIEQFLRNLEENKENQGDIVKTFRDFFYENNEEEQFTKEEIALLFKGIRSRQLFKDLSKSEIDIHDNKLIKGLLYHIGNYNDNIFGSTECLELLINLLSSEKNYDYERFISVLKNIGHKYISKMKFGELIKSHHALLSNASKKLFELLYHSQYEIEKVINYNDYIDLINEINLKEEVLNQ